MVFPLINPNCPDCGEKLEQVDLFSRGTLINPPWIQVFECLECNKSFDNVDLVHSLQGR